jgi:uncharacterized protein
MPASADLLALCRGSRLDFVTERLSPSARWYLPWRYARWRGTNAPPADALSS